ncbi:tail fiber assembly protein [Escherichia coli]|uniref:tail fiber assembly protein n=1 Tax=Enterobacteriaceae TaxID=543 RepID=UPI001BCB4D72|nr:tail fiber assembly protein [Citrobacter freundii]EJK5917511.1 tail fiber assembly protein [Escherichia coli]HBL6893275.1 tail fiber assembly protein [Escherichia coli]
MLWSAQTNSFFFPTEGALIQAPDAVAVDDAIFNEYGMGFAPEGKVRVVGDNGMPAWGDIPPPTREALVAAAGAERQRRIDQANAYMNRRQWPGKAAIGRLKGDELVQYNLWLDYLDALETVDTTSAPDIKWPTPPASAER